MSADPASAWEACASCSAPLAVDQRYCLSCGERRAGARLPFLDVLREASGGPPTRPSASRAAHGVDVVNDRLRRNAPLLGLLGVLAVMMLIGVLVGHWASGDAKLATAPAPRVITVGAGPPAASPAATTPVSSGSNALSKKRKRGASARPAGKSAAPTKATNNNLKNLQNLSGREYQKQIDKLGKTIGTGGKPPPKDNKPPAGGGSFEEIG